MARILSVAGLEVRRFVADRGDLALSLILPIAIFALMMGAFGGGSSFSATAFVVNLDEGRMGAELVARLEQVEGVRVKLLDADDAARRLESASVVNVIVLPADFSERLSAGQRTPIVVRRRGSGGQPGQIITGIARTISQEMAIEAAAGRYVQRLAGDIPASRVSEALDQALDAARSEPQVVVSTEVVGAQGVSVNRMLAGILVMFLMFSVTLSARGVVEDRRLGTLERLMTTRLSANQLFVGRFVAGIGRAVVQTAILMAVAYVLLRSASLAAHVWVLLLSALFAAAVSAIGLLISALARTPDQATWAAVFATMVMSIFGGAFFDLGSSGLFDVLSRFTLHRYAIQLIDGTLASGSIDWLAGRTSLLVLVVVTVGTLTVARMVFGVEAAR